MSASKDFILGNIIEINCCCIVPHLNCFFTENLWYCTIISVASYMYTSET